MQLAGVTQQQDSRTEEDSSSGGRLTYSSVQQYFCIMYECLYCSHMFKCAQKKNTHTHRLLNINETGPRTNPALSHY